MRSHRYDEELPPFRRFSQLSGFSREDIQQSGANLASILRLLFRDGLIIYEEQPRDLGPGGAPVRQVGLYSPVDLAVPLSGHDPWYLHARLFRLKNGTAAERKRFAEVQAMFAILAPNCAFDVTFQPAKSLRGPTQSARHRSATQDSSRQSRWPWRPATTDFPRCSQLGSA